MATNCEDVSAQMMELLYGELPADARANVDAHVAGCAHCRNELEGFEKTRAVARRALDEAPPARARAAILQAAAAHVATQAQPAARKPVVPEKVSFWDRLRARWAFPTMATVGAVAVFFVANRVFLNPERTLERSTAERSTAEPSAAPEQGAAAAPTVTPVPEVAHNAEPAAAPAEPVAGMPRGDRKPSAAKGWADDYRGGADKEVAMSGARRVAPKMKKAEAGERPFAEPPPPKPAPEHQRALRDQPTTGKQFAPPPPAREEADRVRLPPDDSGNAMMDLEKSRSSSSRRTTAAAPPAKHKAPIEDDLLAGEAAAKPSTAPAGGGLGAVGSAAGPSNKADGRGMGYGSGTAQAAPAARPAPARNETAKRPAQAPVVASAPAPPPAMASPPPAAPPPQTQQKTRAKSMDFPSELDEGEGYAAPRESEAKNEKKKAGGKASANASETLKQRADRLFAEGRWAEAAAAYRELLRRDPGNDDADHWRRRMAVAEKADVSERNASIARARKAAPPAAAAKPASKAAEKATSKAASSDSSE